MEHENIIITLDILTKIMEDTAKKILDEEKFGGLYEAENIIKEIQDEYLRKGVIKWQL